jgi:hypothetical protein
MYSATVFINCLIARIPRINYLVVLTSLLMAVYLAIFITSPLGLGFAYLGPSRSFYSLFIIVMSLIAGEGAAGTSILVFNIAMACVHVINVVYFSYFSRRSVATLFTIGEDGMVTAA